MNRLQLKGSDISKSFIGKKYIFEKISFSVGNGGVLGVSGPNGSGKSTLLKIILGQVRQSTGTIEWHVDEKPLSKDDYNDYSGFAAPYLNLYEEFTPLEHISVICRLRGHNFEKDSTLASLEKFMLLEHRNKPIRNFSSGMKQRMKLLIASIHSPVLLVLDEPSSNLDTVGFDLVCRLIDEHKNSDGAVIIASNEEKELALCDNRIFVSNIYPKS